MIENIKPIGNPLTIVAIFAALAEVAGTIALGLVDPTLQEVFIWFVMLFPVLLLVLFFATLNLNPKVLYAPRDFRDDEHFLTALLGADKVSASLDQVAGQLERVRAELVDSAVQEIGAAGNAQRSELIRKMNESFERIQDRIQEIESEADRAYTALLPKAADPKLPLKLQLLQVLEQADQPLTLPQIVVSLPREVRGSGLTRRLRELVEEGLIVRHGDDVRNATFSLGQKHGLNRNGA